MVRLSVLEFARFSPHRIISSILGLFLVPGLSCHVCANACVDSRASHRLLLTRCVTKSFEQCAVETKNVFLDLDGVGNPLTAGRGVSYTVDYTEGKSENDEVSPTHNLALACQVVLLSDSNRASHTRKQAIFFCFSFAEKDTLACGQIDEQKRRHGIATTKIMGLQVLLLRPFCRFDLALALRECAEPCRVCVVWRRSECD
jgi:hypothetical protein